MNRAISGFHEDTDGHWVAELDCGHAQHVRHNPPLSERPWVLSDSGRAERFGTPLDCVRCDAAEIPEHFVESKRTRVFTETTLPAALRSRHNTKTGTWAHVRVISGRLAYRQHSPVNQERILEAGEFGVILPEIEHEVEPIGDVAVEIVFFAAPKNTATPSISSP